MPWALPLPQKQLILTLARGKYEGFNDSHLAEKLCAEEKPLRQPRDRAPHFARRPTGFSAETPASQYRSRRPARRVSA